MAKQLARFFCYHARINFDNVYILNRILGSEEISKIKYEKFFLNMMNNYDSVIENIKEKKRILIIKQGLWSNQYFNIAVLNNIIELVAYALFNGYVPVIKINEGKDDCFHWDWFFKQPADVMGIKDYVNFSAKECDVNTINFVGRWTDYLDMKSNNHKIWHFLYNRFIILNEQTSEYIIRDKNEHSIDRIEKCLGVLIRGTDYVSLKPSFHPVQPDIDEVIEECKKHCEKYEHIYLATEEKSVLNKMTLEFGEEYILTNARMYYDEKYINSTWIGSVHFDRENDNYLKSIEYLSSLIILSECEGLIAGNCGGSRFASLFSNSYKYQKIFDKGLYE